MSVKPSFGDSATYWKTKVGEDQPPRKVYRDPPEKKAPTVNGKPITNKTGL